MPGLGAPGTGIGQTSRGLLRVESNAQIVKRENDERAKYLAAQKEQNKEYVLSLASYMRTCWQAALIAKHSTPAGKDSIQERYLKCQRQRAGVYDPADLAKIRKHGGSEIFMEITSQTCRGIEAWLKDVELPAGEKPWSIDPTPLPDLPDNIEDEIAQTVGMEASQAIAEQGENAVNPKQVRERLDQVRNKIELEQMEIAKAGVRKAETKIQDELLEGNYYEALSEFINDLATYPTAFMTGPVIKQRKTQAWTRDQSGEWTPAVELTYRREYECVSGLDIYPSPGAKNIQDGYLFHRKRLRRSDLIALRGTPGYKNDAINGVLKEYGSGGLKDWLWSDQERADAESTPQEFIDPEHIIDALLFWGQVQRSILQEWGMSTKQIPAPQAEYQISAMLVGNWVIMARLNPHPLGKRNYYSASYEEMNNTIWGKAPPELIRDIQKMCNATARALANNMGIASGPQVEVHMDRMDGIRDVEDLYPWKIWKMKSDQAGRNQKAIHFYQPDSNAQVLLKVYEYFFQQASEISGIPRYMYGSQKVGGAGKTASGLSMLMNAASKTLKNVVFHIDLGLVKPSIREHWMHIMLYDQDIEKTGDIAIVARASDFLIMQEQLQLRRGEFLQNTNNPTDLQITGLKGRAAVLRESVRSLKMPVEDIIPPKSFFEEQERIQKEQQAEMAAQAEAEERIIRAREQGGAIATPAGGKAGGEETRMAA